MPNISPLGLDLLAQFEGCSLVPYKDQLAGGIWTIAYGKTITPSEAEKYKNGCTQAQADQWLIELTLVITKELSIRLPKIILQNQIDALTSFIYNLGMDTFLRSSLYKIIQSRGCSFSVWKDYCHSMNVKVEGLAVRRNWELNLFLYGDYGTIAKHPFSQPKLIPLAERPGTIAPPFEPTLHSVEDHIST